jgi:hypothetical protein
MPNKISFPFLSALKELASWLRSTHVPGMVIGGVAASLLGRPRITQDIDVIVWIDFNKWKDFLKAGKNHGFSPRIKNSFEFARENRVFLLRHSPSRIDIDISLGALPFEEEAIRRAVAKRIKGIRIYLPTPEDLIIMKAVAHRPRDLADIESILDAHPDLDLKRVRRWVREFARSLEMPEILDDLEKITRHPKKRL